MLEFGFFAFLFVPPYFFPYPSKISLYPLLAWRVHTKPTKMDGRRLTITFLPNRERNTPTTTSTFLH